MKPTQTGRRHCLRTIISMVTIWLMLLSSQHTNAQGRVLINEYLSWPGNSCNVTSEYIELYNFGPGPANVGCYIVTDGDYSITIPPGTVIQAGQYYIIAGQNSLPTGCGNISAPTTVNLNWNTCNCTSAPIPSTGDGLLTDGGAGSEQVVLLDPSLNIVDAIVRDLTESSSPITTSTVGGSCTSRTFDLDNLGINYEQVGESQGRGNSFARLTNGGCGWLKDPQQSAGVINNTPGSQSYLANLSLVNPITCLNTGSISVAVSGINLLQVFPMRYTLARDADSNGVYNFSDQYTTGVDSTAPTLNFGSLPHGNYRLVLETAKGCDLKQLDFVILNCSNILLPVYFTSFTLEKTNKTIHLNWDVVNATQVTKYEIEKSRDGTNYSTVGIIYTDSNTSDKQHFSFDDSLSSPIYFRIKLTTKDGRIVYSSMASLLSNELVPHQLSVYPNPAQGDLFIKNPTAKKSSGIIELYASTGRIAKTIAIDFKEGQSRQQIRIADLAQGLYFVRIRLNDQTTYTGSFIKL